MAKNIIKSKNGHTWRRMGHGLNMYFLVDNDRFDNYFESIHEFSKRANPKRYGGKK